MFFNGENCRETFDISKDIFIVFAQKIDGRGESDKLLITDDGERNVSVGRDKHREPSTARITTGREIGHNMGCVWDGFIFPDFLGCRQREIPDGGMGGQARQDDADDDPCSVILQVGSQTRGLWERIQCKDT